MICSINRAVLAWGIRSWRLTGRSKDAADPKRVGGAGLGGGAFAQGIGRVHENWAARRVRLLAGTNGLRLDQAQVAQVGFVKLAVGEALGVVVLKRADDDVKALPFARPHGNIALNLDDGHAFIAEHFFGGNFGVGFLRDGALADLRGHQAPEPAQRHFLDQKIADEGGRPAVAGVIQVDDQAVAEDPHGFQIRKANAFVKRAFEKIGNLLEGKCWPERRLRGLGNGLGRAAAYPQQCRA